MASSSFSGSSTGMSRVRSSAAVLPFQRVLRGYKMLHPNQVQPIKLDPAVLSPVPIKSMAAERQTREIQSKLDDIYKILRKYDTLFAEPIEEYGIEQRNDMRNLPDFAFEKIRKLANLAEWLKQADFIIKGSKFPMTEGEMIMSSDKFEKDVEWVAMKMVVLANINRMVVARQSGNVKLLQALKEESVTGINEMITELLEKNPDIIEAEDFTEENFFTLGPVGFQRVRKQEKEIALPAELEEPVEMKKCNAKLLEVKLKQEDYERRVATLQRLSLEEIGDERMEEVLDKLLKAEKKRLQKKAKPGAKK